jgi:hypothetical protein
MSGYRQRVPKARRPPVANKPRRERDQLDGRPQMSEVLTCKGTGV